LKPRPARRRWDEFSSYGDIVYETDAAGTVSASYVLGNGHLISQTRDGVTGYYLADAQGSTRALTDASGAVVEAYDYAAFGDLLQDIPDPLSSYLYTGQRFDATTAQYHLRAREYDPVVGRFLSRDTWAVDTWHPVELNRYVYAAAISVDGAPL
jgi:RHS repeat-associated protein